VIEYGGYKWGKEYRLLVAPTMLVLTIPVGKGKLDQAGLQRPLLRVSTALDISGWVCSVRNLTGSMLQNVRTTKWRFNILLQPSTYLGRNDLLNLVERTVRMSLILESSWAAEVVCWLKARASVERTEATTCRVTGAIISSSREMVHEVVARSVQFLAQCTDNVKIQSTCVSCVLS
jgi:hypothetical protein